METTFASKAEMGVQYLTKGGIPVMVTAKGLRWFGKPAVEVINQLTKDRVKIYESELLRPYCAELLNKEAITMAKNVKSEKKAGARGVERGARKDGDAVVLFRGEHEAVYDGGKVTYKGKSYATLKEVAEAINGKEISGSGKTFFGLRTEPNIGLGKLVYKGLKEAQAAAKEAAKPVKAKKVRKAKKEDEDDEDESPKTVGAVVAKVMGRGRK